MAFHHEDYGKNIVTLEGNDIFFLDTNIIITYLYKEAKFHEATLLFIRYLIYKQAILCISEVVVMEALNVLSKEMYVSDMLRQPSSKKPGYYRSRWGQHVLKREPENLSKYHEKASELLRPFIENCIIVESDEEQIKRAIELSISVPVGSADALIISTSLGIGANGLLSLDNDVKKVKDITVYTTNVDNSNFDAQSMLEKLDDGFVSYLVEIMGEAEFYNKYPVTP